MGAAHGMGAAGGSGRVKVKAADAGKPRPCLDAGRKKEIMTVKKILGTGLKKDETEIFIRQGEGFHVLAHGNWYQDHILDYLDHEVESFTWQDDGKIYIDIK